MDDDANILNVRFCKSVIHSVASLTYDEAQAMLDDPDRSDPVAGSVKLLNHLARILRQRRISEGALTLASPEVRFKLDSESQNPTDVSMYQLKESNALVEEWMLLANITVSKKILRHFPTLGVLRRHQPPSREQFAPLLSAASAVGVTLDITTSKTLADSLDAAVRAEDPYFNKLLRIMSTRCMMPAQYFCSGEIDKSQWHHYGLAAPVYTHFTSPIRRYADVIVHR
jgi:exosome complex exonuclease DIS3/RRP44